MTNTTHAIAVVLLICATTPVAAGVQGGSVRTGQLDPRIGPAVPQRYESILDAQNWLNPYLVVGRDGIEIIATRLRSRGKIVTASDLERTLIALPVTAWPYGRVAVVSEIGIREADRSDDKPIADNLEAVLVILKRLNVTVERWPS